MNKLETLFNKGKEIFLSGQEKIIIFSDLHLGNGGINDDFKRNSRLFIETLKNYYLKNDYLLILNGDIEELIKFSFKKISDTWQELYELFDAFHQKGKLIKIFGNHDFELSINKGFKQKYDIYESIKLILNNNIFFIYHGHQTGTWIENYNKLTYFLIKYILRFFENKIEPLYNNKVYKVESNAYNFSKTKKVISILGHTHRPLFESHSKIDSLKILIEKLISKYFKENDYEKKQRISQFIVKFKAELEKRLQNRDEYLNKNHIYDDGILSPCLFNSGSITGKRGFTGIEIKNGKIALVYWFDIINSQRYLDYKGVKFKQLNQTNYYKAILKKDRIEYLFSRIKLLC